MSAALAIYQSRFVASKKSLAILAKQVSSGLKNLDDNTAINQAKRLVKIADTLIGGLERRRSDLAQKGILVNAIEMPVEIQAAKILIED